VLTATLSAAAAARGLSLLALDPDSTPEQWEQAGVDVLVHKAPEEMGEPLAHRTVAAVDVCCERGGDPLHQCDCTVANTYSGESRRRAARRSLTHSSKYT
jgi:hypothetical protein